MHYSEPSWEGSGPWQSLYPISKVSSVREEYETECKGLEQPTLEPGFLLSPSDSVDLRTWYAD